MKPIEQSFMYRHPYPEWMEQVALPNRYKLPEFTKFSRKDNVSTIEHVSSYLAQLGNASAQEALRVHLFPLSLSGSTFSCFASLPGGSVRNWANLEKKFHSYFYTGMAELSISDLTAVRQKTGESVADYVQRFRNVRSRCYTLNFTNRQMTEIAYQGLNAQIREKFAPQEFDGLAQLVHRASMQESRIQNTHERQFQAAYAEYSSNSEGEEINLAEWSRSKKTVLSSWVKQVVDENRFDIDLNKADKIFDLLL